MTTVLSLAAILTFMFFINIIFTLLFRMWLKTALNRHSSDGTEEFVIAIVFVIYVIINISVIYSIAG